MYIRTYHMCMGGSVLQISACFECFMHVIVHLVMGHVCAVHLVMGHVWVVERVR